MKKILNFIGIIVLIITVFLIYQSQKNINIFSILFENIIKYESCMKRGGNCDFLKEKVKEGCEKGGVLVNDLPLYLKFSDYSEYSVLVNKDCKKY